MRLLLDTRAWLWMGLDSKRLGKKTRALLEDGDNELLLSAASVWEIALKVSSDKLRLPMDAGTYVRTRLRASRMSALSITFEHALAVEHLPLHHADPFDRILIAQALSEGLTIVTSDLRIGEYGVAVHDAAR